MKAQVPREAIERLSPFFDSGTSFDFDLRFGPLIGSMEALAPCALGPRAVMAVSINGAGRNLRPIGRSTAGVVTLHPRFGDLETASGLALLAHETVHQQQFLSIPNFNDEYARANRGIDRDRPWDNRFELEAYMKERDVFCSLVASGFPKGSWTPLGVQAFGC